MQGQNDSVLTRIRAEPRAVLATLVSATGGSVRKLGATMWVGASGRILGGVTIGGCVDGRVLRAADEVLSSGCGRVIDIAVDDEEAWSMGLTCGGTLRVSLEAIAQGSTEKFDAVALDDLLPALFAGRGEVVSAFVPGGTGERLLVADGAIVAGSLGDPVLDRNAARIASELTAHDRAVTSMVGGAIREYEVFFQRRLLPWTLVIVGAGEIAVSLTRLAKELEMRVVVVDGRERYATAARFPLADDVQVGMPSAILAAFADDPNVAIVIIAHDYRYELPVLRAVLRSCVGYIGLLGSRTRGKGVKQMLVDEGYTETELSKVHTPIGMDIGGSSPAEIALAILAEVTAVRNGRLR